ncbi:TetR/AcrR family transcriptional regulator [Priestia aryabhattai]|uniref:TetR/AcrR family transcriptional regulator n=1 Tax=Priestia aryabhattai TaxID=412384 RepID=UPI00203E7D86|nr:TetR/AcrR family transcriptional regulator [Priestia aryabhattai]MCM3770760.1 TetR/AcrR family transcriptional regulator [Priestia aryabhattai]
MANSKTDRRIIRTKRFIRDALTELMEEKGFEGVTVRDLTKKADINRGTFYLHYQDKYDLLEKSENEVIQEIKEFIKKANPNEIVSTNLKEQPLPFIVALFEYIQENARFMQVMLGPKGNPGFHLKIKEVMKTNMLEKLELVNSQTPPLVPLEHLMSYVTSAHLGVIQYWLEQDMKQSPREMALTLASMTFFGPVYVAGIKRT